MILSIDTAKLEQIEFKLLEGKKVVAEYSTALEYHENGDILKHLDIFLRKQGLTPPPTSHVSRLTSIRVSAGTGSYTGIRVGTSIAQALSLAWNIPLKIIKK